MMQSSLASPLAASGTFARTATPPSPTLLPPWVQQLAMPVWVSGPAGEIVWVNPAAERLLAVDRVRAIGRPCHEVVAARHEDGRRFCTAGCRVAVRAARGVPLEPVECRIGRPGRTVQWARWTVIPIAIAGFDEPWLVHCAEDVDRARRMQDYVARLASRSEPLRALDGDSRPGPLSPRQCEILELLSQDLELGQIAARLGIRHTTVRNHVQAILARLGAHSVQEAVARHLIR